ncbi:MAG: carbon-nitrogen hydrolase family protein [Desulfurococcales archaeon]|nr:carbon-nitrogen hydrolase family protein [Desulfurococcales archaeon]
MGFTLEGLARFEADLVVLPENWVSPGPVGEHDYLEAVEGVAAEAPGAVVVGAQYIDVGGSVASLGLAYRDGKLWRLCEKLFPSVAVGERSFVEPGRLRGPLEVGGWRVSCSVCVDIFYPELARIQALIQGAQVILNPSKIPEDRVQLWRSALLARASENSVYVVGVNAAGERYKDGREVIGGSAVYTPDGRPLLEAGWGRASYIVELDPERIAYARVRWAFRMDAERLFGEFYRRAYEALTREGGKVD